MAFLIISPKGNLRMSTEQNKAKATRFIHEVLNTGNLGALSEFMAADYVEQAAPPGLPPTSEGVGLFFAMLRQTFPDFQYTIEDVVAEEDKVVLRVTGHGTMQGALMAMPATGQHADWAEIHIARFRNGMMVEHWAVIDQMSMLQQLGLMPPPGQG
jgi:steroid delta-isomerase-like uncharacterized protein